MLLLSYSCEYACMHLFDAAYCTDSSYSDSYWTLCLLYGKDEAMKGYKKHIGRKSILPKIIL